MCQYTAENGEANDWHFVHIAASRCRVPRCSCIEGDRRGSDRPHHARLPGLVERRHRAALKPIMAMARKHSKIAVAMQLAHAGRKASSHVPWDGGQLIPLAEGGWQPVARRRCRTRRLRPRLRARRCGVVRVREAFVAATKRADRRHRRARIALRPRLSPASVPSPIANRRTDRYGGSLQNRMRFPLEVFDAVRAGFRTTSRSGVRFRRPIGSRAVGISRSRSSSRKN